MWQQESKWQDAQFRILVAAVVVYLVGTIGYGIVARDGELLTTIAKLVGLGAAMLGGYAVTVKLLGEFCRRRWGQREHEQSEPPPTRPKDEP